MGASVAVVMSAPTAARSQDPAGSLLVGPQAEHYDEEQVASEGVPDRKRPGRTHEARRSRIGACGRAGETRQEAVEAADSSLLQDRQQ